MRSTLLAGLTAAAFASSAFAQRSQEALDGVFLDLRQLQDANLGIARQISDIQQRAAAVLGATLAAGAITDPAQQQLVDALVANALTLATVVLAPVASQDVATGAVFSNLLANNLSLVATAEPLLLQNPGLAEAMEQYAVMQVQTQDLSLALLDGWNRYADAVATAETAGLLPAGGFNASARNWTLTLPDIDAAALAAMPGKNTAAMRSERLGADAPALDPSIFGTVPDAEVATALAKEAARLAGMAPEAEAQPAAWMVMIGDNARAVAKARNANAATSDRIRGLQIGCHPNGTLRYIFETDRSVGEYLVFANKEQHAAIRANDNIVSGTEAIHMSDVLRLAFEWATGTAEPSAHIMVAAGDDPEAVAYFPVSGYLDARGRVLDGCLPWQEEEDDIRPVDEAADSASVAVPVANEAGASPDIVPALELVAPVPHPRPASRMPVDLMNAG